MRKLIVLLCPVFLISGLASAQSDSLESSGIFEKISSELQMFKLDTTAAPEDKSTKLIRKLRSLHGGFNIDEAIAYKMEEERREKKTPEADLELLRKQFREGKAKQWLDNAVIHIYRHHFTEKELKQLVKFYKTQAGRKMAADFPLVMMKSLMAAQIIHDEILKRKNLWLWLYK